MRQFEQMGKEYDSLTLEEGRITESGGVICPGCGYELSITEALEQPRISGLHILECPNCHKKFKSH